MFRAYLLLENFTISAQKRMLMKLADLPYPCEWTCSCCILFAISQNSQSFGCSQSRSSSHQTFCFLKQLL